MRKRKTRTSSTTTDPRGATPTALALGSNLDDPERQLVAALGPIARLLDDLEVAGLFRSSPVSQIDQPDYLNTAVIGTSRVPPEALLGELKRIEYRAGRRRDRRFGPRVLDIDLLLWGQEVSRLPELTLPHPRLRERAFVLAPLAEIAGDWRVPPDGRTVAGLWSELGPQRGLERCDWSRQPLL